MRVTCIIRFNAVNALADPLISSGFCLDELNKSKFLTETFLLELFTMSNINLKENVPDRRVGSCAFVNIKRKRNFMLSSV